MPNSPYPGIIFRKTKKYGMSIFARKNFRKGEIVFVVSGSIIKTPSIYTVPIDFNLYIDPLPPGRFLNHACEPSCGIKKRTEVVAMKNLKKGDEITIDYGMIVPKYDSTILKQNIVCRCGSKNCRGEFGSYEKLTPELKRKYKGFVSDYLRPH
jgi:hypothetical protein